MKQLLFLLINLLFINAVIAQNADCKVSLDSIKGTYTGECKNGKAHGTGMSVGVHTYDGEFKNGFPEGNGKYTWANGDYFYGIWKRGKKEGKGQMHRFENGIESMIAGYWKNDVYRGEFEHPYLIQNKTTFINNVEVTKMSSTDQTVTVSVTGALSSGGYSALTTMTSFFVIRGTYLSKSNSTLTNTDVTIFRGVVFPFRATFVFGESSLEVEFFEQGAWDVKVPISR